MDKITKLGGVFLVIILTVIYVTNSHLCSWSIYYMKSLIHSYIWTCIR